LVFPTITTGLVNDDRHLHSADVVYGGGFGTMPAFTADILVEECVHLWFNADCLELASGGRSVVHLPIMGKRQVPMPGRLHVIAVCGNFNSAGRFDSAATRASVLQLALWPKRNVA